MKNLIKKSLLAVAATAGLFTTTSTFADHRHGGGNYGTSVIIRGSDCGPRRVWIEPVYEERQTRVWVPAAYRTVCDRVWVEAVYETRCVTRRDHCGRLVTVHERVCVRPGGWQNVERQVCVSEGRWENRCERACVRDGCWETVSYGHPRYNSGVAVSFGGIFR
jgi:hypothetical protein